MSKLYNQTLLYNNLVRCETLAGNVVDKLQVRNDKKAVALKNPSVLEKTYNYIFGKSDENPLKEISDEFNATENSYLATCDSFTQQVLNSKK